MVATLQGPPASHCFDHTASLGVLITPLRTDNDLYNSGKCSTYDDSCIIKNIGQNQQNKVSISSYKFSVASARCQALSWVWQWKHKSDMGGQIHHLPLMRGRKDHPGRGNGIAKTQRHEQHGTVLQHNRNIGWKQVTTLWTIRLECWAVCLLALCRVGHGGAEPAKVSERRSVRVIAMWHS